MRIVVDNISPGESTGPNGPGGMRQYMTSLLCEFSQQAPQHDVTLLSPAWADSIVRGNSGVRTRTLAAVPRSRALRILYQQTVLPVAAARAGGDVFFATATVAPLALRIPTVVAVQFLQFYEAWEAYGRMRTAYLKRAVPGSTRRAVRAIVFTEFARRELIRLTGTAAEKIRVVPHGITDEIHRAGCAPRRDLPPAVASLTNDRPYLLYVSATYGYKNHLGLIRAYAHAKQKCRFEQALLLVGAEQAIPHETLRREADALGVGDDVIVAGRVPDVIAIHQHATAAVIPTLYETFGFPALEAMALGCPVITSNRGSMAELAGDAAVLVDPTDGEALGAAMIRVIRDAALRAELVERGRARVKPYTWSASARRTLDVLEEAACVSSS